MDNKDKIILDLCGGTGAWSRPYKDAGYDVRVITLPRFDITQTITDFKDAFGDWLIFYRDLKEGKMMVDKTKVYGILAAPPCTMFSIARTKADKPRDLKEGMECVRACLNIIWSCMEVKQDTRYKTVSLKFWALENPKGMLKFFMGKPAFEFNPYDFGDEYQKHTYLWGWFGEPKKHPIKLPRRLKELHKTKFAKKFGMLASRDIVPEMFGKMTRQERRSITPSGFASAFCKANL